jgi:hypothetical protein
MKKFGEKKMTIHFHNELGYIKMDTREKVKDFNQIFLNVLINFPNDVAPTKSLDIEYYTTTLTPSIGMFVKRANKNTLALNFDEAETMEKELSTYDQHLHYEDTKSAGKKPFMLAKPPNKESKDIENVIKMVKKLSNEVVDLKKNVGEGSSKPQNFLPFFKRPDSPPKPPEPPHMDFNLYSFSNDIFFSYHKKQLSTMNMPSVGQLYDPGDKSFTRSIKFR